jgi:sarcosine oxidase subunit alpha
VTITFEGRPIEAVEGEPIAAALLAAGVRTLRRSERARTPRGVFCNIGHCYECRVVIDGERDVRACLTPVRPGLSVERQGLDAPPRGEGGS